MTRVPITTVLNDLWDDLSSSQKFISVALVLVIFVAFVGSWGNTFSAWSELRMKDREVVEAKRNEAEALEQAAKIVSTIKIREEELAKVEAKKDAKKQEVEQAKRDVDRARAEYDRAVVARDPIIPSTDQLCQRLADAGHPCS